jgi:hypothetical protein
VKIGALVGAAHHRANQIGVFPDLLIAHRRLEQMGAFIDPMLKVQRGAVVVYAWDVMGGRHKLIS